MRGEYEEARSSLAPYFERIGQWPNVATLGNQAAAEILLRAASISSNIGHEKQITDAQPFARRLIHAARELFESKDKIAECWKEEAVTYWREGRYGEAAPLLTYALSLAERLELQVLIRCNQGLVEIFRNNSHYALFIYDRTFSQAEQSTAYCQGVFFNGRALANKRLGHLRPAIDDYLLALIQFELIGNVKHRATIESNLGSVYLTLENYHEAGIHLESACQLFGQIKDIGSQAQVDETRARLLHATGFHEQAKALILSVIRRLETGDERGLLAEARQTAEMIFGA